MNWTRRWHCFCFGSMISSIALDFRSFFDLGQKIQISNAKCTRIKFIWKIEEIIEIFLRVADFEYGIILIWLRVGPQILHFLNQSWKIDLDYKIEQRIEIVFIFLVRWFRITHQVNRIIHLENRNYWKYSIVVWKSHSIVAIVLFCENYRWFP